MWAESSEQRREWREMKWESRPVTFPQEGRHRKGAVESVSMMESVKEETGASLRNRPDVPA